MKLLMTIKNNGLKLIQNFMFVNLVVRCVSSSQVTGNVSETFVFGCMKVCQEKFYKRFT